MADTNGKTSGPAPENPDEGSALADAAARVLDNLAELEPELVNAGIFDRNLESVCVTSTSPDWPKQAVALLTALESGSGEEVFDSAHIAGTEGEVFAVTEAGLSLVAVTGRFVLASLTSYDIRMALRDAASVVASSEQGEPLDKAENGGSKDA